MGASLPALIQRHAREGERGLCRYGVAAWGEARGGLGRLIKGCARGGARTSHAGASALGLRAMLRWPPRVGRTEGARRPHLLEL